LEHGVECIVYFSDRWFPAMMLPHTLSSFTILHTFDIHSFCARCLVAV